MSLLINNITRAIYSHKKMRHTSIVVIYAGWSFISIDIDIIFSQSQFDIKSQILHKKQILFIIYLFI